jgi:hypothetical protein
MGVVAPRRRRVGAGWWVAGGCVALAAISLAFPFGLIYDSWSWAIWARQLAHGTLATDGLTAWKPLPPLVGLPAAALGGSPAVAWLLVERAAALGALALGYRLAARRGGVAAGVLAVVLLVLVDGMLRYVAEGYSEPVVVALLLGAVLAALERRPGVALAALTGAALIRPETWPLLVLYGVIVWGPASGARVIGRRSDRALPLRHPWAWRAQPRLRVWLGVAVVAIVVLWFGGQWLGSGDPLAGSKLARAASVPDSSFAGVALPFVVGWIGVVAALWWGLRRRDTGVLLPAGAAVAWTLAVLFLDAVGYPGIERFLVPAAALWSVVGAIGLVWLVDEARALGGRTAAAGAAVGLALVAVGFGIARVDGVVEDADLVAQRVDAQTELRDAVARIGRDRLARSAPCVNVAFQTALAWQLDLRATQVCAPLAPPVAACSTWVLATDDRRVTGPAPPDGPIRVGASGQWRITRAKPGTCQEA